MKVSPGMDKLFQEAIAVLKSKGATIVEVELYKANKTGGQGRIYGAFI